VLTPETEDVIARLSGALEPVDRAPFRQAAEAALAARPPEPRGPGADYRRVAACWCGFVHPPKIAHVPTDSGSCYRLDRVAG
jgi:hypothetical protein